MRAKIMCKDNPPYTAIYESHCGSAVAKHLFRVLRDTGCDLIEGDSYRIERLPDLPEPTTEAEAKAERLRGEGIAHVLVDHDSRGLRPVIGAYGMSFEPMGGNVEMVSCLACADAASRKPEAAPEPDLGECPFCHRRDLEVVQMVFGGHRVGCGMEPGPAADGCGYRGPTGKTAAKAAQKHKRLCKRTGTRLTTAKANFERMTAELQARHEDEMNTAKSRWRHFKGRALAAESLLADERKAHEAACLQISEFRAEAEKSSALFACAQKAVDFVSAEKTRDITRLEAELAHAQAQISTLVVGDVGTVASAKIKVAEEMELFAKSDDDSAPDLSRAEAELLRAEAAEIRVKGGDILLGPDTSVILGETILHVIYGDDTIPHDGLRLVDVATNMCFATVRPDGSATIHPEALK